MDSNALFVLVLRVLLVRFRSRWGSLCQTGHPVCRRNRIVRCIYDAQVFTTASANFSECFFQLLEMTPAPFFLLGHHSTRNTWRLSDNSVSVRDVYFEPFLEQGIWKDIPCLFFDWTTGPQPSIVGSGGGGGATIFLDGKRQRTFIGHFTYARGCRVCEFSCVLVWACARVLVHDARGRQA